MSGRSGSNRRTDRRVPNWVAHLDPTPFGTVVVFVLSLALVGMAALDPVGTALWLARVLGVGGVLGVAVYVVVARLHPGRD